MRHTLWLVLLVVGFNPLSAQRPLIEVRFPDADRSELVVGRLDADARLLLPTDRLETLLGEQLGAGPWITLDGLREALGPGVEVVYDPNAAALVVRDPRTLLQASRLALEERLNVARAAVGSDVGAGVGGRGPWAEILADDRRETVVAAGWGGRWWALAGSHSSLSDKTGLQASLSPLRGVWLSYRDDSRSSATATLRAARGPVFVALNTDTDRVEGRAALMFGPLTAYATTAKSAALTYLNRRIGTTIAYDSQHDRWTTRLSFGRALSALSLPRVR